MLNIYNEAYALIIEILNDQDLQDFVFEHTGKHLAIIDAGAQVSAPAARISFNGGNISLSDNSIQHTSYSISCALPFWGADALAMCHDFIDHALFAFSSHCFGSGKRGNYITNINPSIIELNDDSDFWTVNFEITVSIFL